MLSACLQMTVRVGKLTVRVSSDEAILLDATAGASSSRSQSASSILSRRTRQQRTPAKRGGSRTSALGRPMQHVPWVLRDTWSITATCQDGRGLHSLRRDVYRRR